MSEMAVVNPVDGVGTLSQQTVVVIGGSSGIGFEVARQAHLAGARVTITGRNAERLSRASDELGGLPTASVDLTDPGSVRRFFEQVPSPLDHVLISGGGPVYAPIVDLDFDEVRRVLDEHLIGALRVARECVDRVRAAGSLTLITGTGARRPGIGLSVSAIGSVGGPAMTADIALELAPIRVNAIAAGFVDTPLSARLLGDDLDRRREELRRVLPIRRVVEPADVAALALHLMVNTALTGATYDIDGGQQLVRG